MNTAIQTQAHAPLIKAELAVTRAKLSPVDQAGPLLREAIELLEDAYRALAEQSTRDVCADLRTAGGI